MTPPSETAPLSAKLPTGVSPTKRPTKWPDVLHYLKMTGSEVNPFWAPVGEATVLTERISYGDLARRGELIRELLQQQLGTIFGHSRGLDEIRHELTSLSRLLEALTVEVEQLTGDLVQTVCIPLRSFAPERFDVATPIDIVISPEEDGFQASFLDGNLHAYGETKEEALSNIKSAILDTYQRLRELPDARLGRSLLRQKQVLNHHLREAHTS